MTVFPNSLAISPYGLLDVCVLCLSSARGIELVSSGKSIAITSFMIGLKEMGMILSWVGNLRGSTAFQNPITLELEDLI